MSKADNIINALDPDYIKCPKCGQLKHEDDISYFGTAILMCPECLRKARLEKYITRGRVKYYM